MLGFERLREGLLEDLKNLIALGVISTLVVPGHKLLDSLFQVFHLYVNLYGESWNPETLHRLMVKVLNRSPPAPQPFTDTMQEEISEANSFFHQLTTSHPNTKQLSGLFFKKCE